MSDGVRSRASLAGEGSLREKFGALTPVIVLLCAIWALQVLNWMLGYRLNDWFGLEPRDFGGLLGIFGSPFLHANFTHAISNSVPLAVLGGLAVLSARREFPIATFIIVVLGGLLTWIFGRGGSGLTTVIHVGASGLIFGYFGFLIAYGWIERRALPVVGALAAIVFYGGLIWGVLPTDQRISWEGHLFGFLAGVAAAYAVRTKRLPA
ncbi:rhomboid family intramembrane serine protease [Neomegalonema sp.]|uniref:rhomboid family intramembrane serine protease n=1 Tax=Neomegalonema sp. TaxID=2039713 RepID=UPI0026071632|nr:rhomboid family intramembrane serine protease [Neomegalonema sp.]MDD2867574.1 rhomboid family intramembrane serine protease [Neomegalonema sp.]